MTDKGPRYATVGDYLRVMRRRRGLIVLVIAASIAIAIGISLSQSTKYTAEAQVSFRDPLQDLVLLGQGSQIFSDITPGQRAIIQSDLLTRPEVTRRVAKELDTDLDGDTLAGAITSEVNPLTNLVIVRAVWSDAEFAADLANTFANEAARIGDLDAERRLGAAENALQDDLRDAKQQRPLPGIRISVIEGNLERLRGLQTITEPAEVVGTADVPTSPTSPQPLRNGILGAILGLVFAIIAAFVRDSSDRRLHSVEDVHGELGLPIVGKVGATSFAHSGLVSNGTPPVDEREFEAFRILRMNLAFLAGERPPRSVLVTSPLAEEGKTTVSISLASAAALAGTNVLLVECDLRRPSFAKRMGIKQTPGLSDFLEGGAAPSDILRVVPLMTPSPVNGQATGSRMPDLGGKKSDNGRKKPGMKVQESGFGGSKSERAADRPGHSANMVVIPAGKSVTNAAELLQSDRFESFMDKVSRAYELVILDCGPLLSVADPLELVNDTEAVLVCVRVQQTTREQAQAARVALSHLPERPYGVVVTGLKPGDETYDYYGY
jgi:Mrp family chromosome partitioning ATPase/capsular polysaccharide biosynthesis protein